MTDVCTMVVNILLADEDLVDVLGGEYVYQLLAPESALFPRIVVAEADREYVAFSDDVPTFERVEVEVTIYGERNVLFVLANLVHTALTSNRFKRGGVGEDRYLADSYVYAKTILYELYIDLLEEG